MHVPWVLFTERRSALVTPHLKSYLFKRGPVNFLHKRIHLHISSRHKFYFSYKVENIVSIWNKQTIISSKKQYIYPFMLFLSIVVNLFFFFFKVLYILFIILLEFHCYCIYSHSTLAEFQKVYFLPFNVAKRNLAWIQNISVLIMLTVVCNFASSFYIIMSIESILKGNHFLH